MLGKSLRESLTGFWESGTHYPASGKALFDPYIVNKLELDFILFNVCWSVLHRNNLQIRMPGLLVKC